jgi:replicative DNA helicase
MATSPELLLLSSVIRTGEHKALNAAGVTPEMFHQYPEEGKWLFGYIHRHRRAPSRSALRHRFPEMRLVKVDDIDYYAEEVRKQHVRHAVMETLDSVVSCVEGENIDKAMAELQVGMAEIQKRASGVNDHFDAFGDWTQTYNEVAARHDRVTKFGMSGVPSGFKTLDDVTGGFQPGWFSVIAARLGQGKTWTGIRCAFAAVCTDHDVAYYSLEQSRHQVAMRVHSFAAKKYGQYLFNSLDLSRGKGFDLAEYHDFLKDLKGQVGGRLWINDTSRGQVTPAAIASAYEIHQPDIIFIDYLTLMKTNGDDWRATAALSGEIQGVAQQYQVPVVGMAQVNRLGAGKEPPGAENLSQADAIGHDADLLVTMAKQSDSVMKLRIAKFRHGPDNLSWYAKFKPGTGQYDEITYEQAQDLIEKDKEIK